MKYEQLHKDKVKDMHNTELLRACKEDKELMGEFLMHNRDFIYSIINKYLGGLKSILDKFDVTEEEVLQQGYIGVITSLQKFDFDKGVKFTTYAAKPVIWEINKLLYGESNTVKLSRGAIALMKRMKELEVKLNYTPTFEEMADLLDVPIERIYEIIRFSGDNLSYSTAWEVADEDESFFEDKIVDRMYAEEVVGNLELDEFDTKVADMVKEGLSDTQIARNLDVFPMAINRAIKRIRKVVEEGGYVQKLSKYDRETKAIAEEMEETGYLLHIQDIKELFDVCGFGAENYNIRILYYIREKARALVDKELKESEMPVYDIIYGTKTE